MRALLVTNDFPPQPGGIQQYLFNLVAHSTVEFRVLGPAFPGVEAELGVVRGHSSYMVPSRRTRRWVEEHVEDFRPDVVVFGAPHPLAWLGAGLGDKFGLPYVVLAHGGEVTVPGAVLPLRWLMARIFRHASLVFTVSAFTAGKVRKMTRTRTEVLGAGVDLEVFAPGKGGSGDALVLGCISRFIPRKGHLRVVAAAERLLASGMRVEVLLAGGGRLEKRIRNRAAGASVPVRVVCPVSWEGLADLYRECDIFVMPARSRWLGLDVEGLGIVFLEALASGLPVIAGTSGGAPETVIPGVTGVVAGSVSGIVEGVRLIADRRDVMGRAARMTAENQFSWEAVAARFDAGLEQVARRGC